MTDNLNTTVRGGDINPPADALESTVTLEMVRAGYRAYRKIVDDQDFDERDRDFDYWMTRRFSAIFLAMEAARAK